VDGRWLRRSGAPRDTPPAGGATSFDQSFAVLLARGHHPRPPAALRDCPIIFDLI
jgi:hypothetical protein